MYFGSVRFFKHLILAVLALCIIIPCCAAVVLSANCRELEQRLSETEQTWAQAWATTQQPLPTDTNGQASPPQPEALSYQALYPELFTGLPIQYNDSENKVYLTFDDGPSETTIEILDTLKDYGVKASFFVTYRTDEQSQAIYQRIVNEGHTIGIHTSSHDYRTIYRSVDNFLADFDLVYQQIVATTGVKPILFRFPGGSINAYDAQNYQDIIAEMTRRGFIYHDWNVVGDDTNDRSSASGVYTNTINGVREHDKSVVLLHDTQSYTAQALPDILATLLAGGYEFASLDEHVKPFQFSYPE